MNDPKGRFILCCVEFVREVNITIYISWRMLSYSSSLVFISCFADISLHSCKQFLVLIRHGHDSIYTRHCTVKCSLAQFPLKKNFPRKSKWSHFNQWNCFIWNSTENFPWEEINHLRYENLTKLLGEGALQLPWLSFHEEIFAEIAWEIHFFKKQLRLGSSTQSWLIMVIRFSVLKVG